MSKKFWYVYRIERNVDNCFYIGMRGCCIDPVNDLGVKYFTSGQLKEDFQLNPNRYSIEIIKSFDKKMSAEKFEAFHIMVNFENKLCKNLAFNKKLAKAYNVVRPVRSKFKTEIRSDFTVPIQIIPAGFSTKKKSKKRNYYRS